MDQLQSVFEQKKPFKLNYADNPIQNQDLEMDQQSLRDKAALIGEIEKQTALENAVESAKKRVAKHSMIKQNKFKELMLHSEQTKESFN